ncbi:hypothetical protein ABIE26_001518 [Pedobacter africanus]|uniref:Uncharacterized protein n=1 Tax=Pedobacter africanus TaxID=151894 RepID=A0ACC6KRL5_9SPHI|nr:hypothetical protein [Pedobacter africanus]MDR6781993.1 hypothetical protein [Pedobacter africanus]
MEAAGGLQPDYYKKTDADTPYLEFSITTRGGKTIKVSVKARKESLQSDS